VRFERVACLGVGVAALVLSTGCDVKVDPEKA